MCVDNALRESTRKVDIALSVQHIRSTQKADMKEAMGLKEVSKIKMPTMSDEMSTLSVHSKREKESQSITHKVDMYLCVFRVHIVCMYLSLNLFLSLASVSVYYSNPLCVER